MFVSIGLRAIRLHGRTIIELMNDQGYRGSALIYDCALPCSNSKVDLSVVLTPPTQAMDKSTQKRRKQISKKQEERIAKDHEGRRHKGSGSRLGYAGDARTDGCYRIEAKYTTHSSFRVNLSDLNKIRSECAMGEAPVFVIDFKEPNTLQTQDSWVLVPYNTWKEHAQAALNQRSL